MFSLGQYGPAIALVAASFTGCNPWLTISLLTIGVGLNGGIYSGFKVNHLDISPRFAGILMAITNCLANLAGLLAPIYAGNVIKGQVNFYFVSFNLNFFLLCFFFSHTFGVCLANASEMENRFCNGSRGLRRMLHVLRDLRFRCPTKMG